MLPSPSGASPLRHKGNPLLLGVLLRQASGRSIDGESRAVLEGGFVDFLHSPVECTAFKPEQPIKAYPRISSTRAGITMSVSDVQQEKSDVLIQLSLLGTAISRRLEQYLNILSRTRPPLISGILAAPATRSP